MNPLSIFPKHAMRALLILVAAGTLIVAAGCGGGNNNGGGGGGGGNNGNFSNASLNGHYAFTLRGIGTPDNVNSFFFVEGGVFTADGNGNLTSITDDFVEDFQCTFNLPATGSYKINKDGSGDLQFNFGNSTSALYRITFGDSSHFYMEEDDGFNTSGGSGEKQDPTAFASIPSGTFVLQTHDLAAGSSKVGVTTWTGGTITGTGDALVGGALSSVTISGTAQAPATATGRGTVTITDDTGTSNYAYYVVNASKIRLFNTDFSSSLGIGTAEKQTGGPFSAASLNGPYVFGSAGETSNVAGIHSVGLFTADGAGHVTDGSFDFVQDGSPVTDITLNSGSAYIVDATSGRAKVDLNLSTGTTNEKVMYLVSPSRALFLVNDPINVEDGTADKQAGSAFSNSSMSGQYAFVMDGFDANAQLPYRDRVGTWTPNGSGTVSTSYVASGFLPSSPPAGSATANTLSGTYSVGTNGRTTSTVNNLSNNLIFYMVSGNSGYMLQADTGVDIGGAFAKQP